MRIILFLILTFHFSVYTFAQEYFFEFVPGWRNLKISEKNNFYLSFGLGDYISSSSSSNLYSFSEISFNSDIDSTWDFLVDTAFSTSTRLVNTIYSSDKYNYICGAIRGEQSFNIYGTLIRFENNFQDTILTKVYDLGVDTRMEIILPVENNQMIVGGLLSVEQYVNNSAMYSLDTLGNIIWSQMYACGDNCDLIPYHILKASDEGYFYTIKKYFSLGQPEYTEKTTIIKTDSLGNEQYRLHPGNPDLFTVSGWVLPTDDGNYITAYSDPMTITNSLPQGNNESTIWINKFDIEGNEIFENSLWDYLPKIEPVQIGYRYTITQMLITADNNILIVGYKIGVKDLGFILKITQEGEPLWYRFISPPQAAGNDAAFESTKILGITPTSDGGYIMAGEYISTAGNIFPEDIQTAIAVKVDEFGCLEPGCHLADGVAEDTKANLGLKVYPNPASGKVNVSVSENVTVEKVRVYEVTGRLVLDKRPFDYAQGDIANNKIQLDISGLVNGIYLLEVETKNGFREVKRLMVE